MCLPTNPRKDTERYYVDESPCREHCLVRVYGLPYLPPPSEDAAAALTAYLPRPIHIIRQSIHADTKENTMLKTLNVP
jgi:hypothetical protein